MGHTSKIEMEAYEQPDTSVVMVKTQTISEVEQEGEQSVEPETPTKAAETNTAQSKEDAEAPVLVGGNALPTFSKRSPFLIPSDVQATVIRKDDLVSLDRILHKQVLIAVGQAINTKVGKAVLVAINVHLKTMRVEFVTWSCVPSQEKELVVLPKGQFELHTDDQSDETLQALTESLPSLKDYVAKQKSRMSYSPRVHAQATIAEGIKNRLRKPAATKLTEKTKETTRKKPTKRSTKKAVKPNRMEKEESEEEGARTRKRSSSGGAR